MSSAILEYPTKTAALNAIAEANFSSRKMVERIEELITLSDQGTEKEKIGAINALLKINAVVEPEYSSAVESGKLLKLLKAFSGLKGAKLTVDEILSSANIFSLISRIETYGFKVHFESNSIKINTADGFIYAEAYGNSFEETAKNGIIEFLLKRG